MQDFCPRVDMLKGNHVFVFTEIFGDANQFLVYTKDPIVLLDYSK